VPLHQEKTCNRGVTLSWQASPYLYPCSVQYYLIVAGIIWQMYRHIGAMTSPVSANEHLSDVVTSSHEDRASTAVDCDKVVCSELLIDNEIEYRYFKLFGFRQCLFLLAVIGLIC